MNEEEMKQNLRKWFGHPDFREGQRAPVEAVLSGKDAVVVMPTGSGKSLCYQFAALALPGTTVVVSPLIALMKDQVDALQAKGIAAVFLNSSVAQDELDSRMDKMVRGEYKLVYVAPERFRVKSFQECLAKTEVSLLTVDEAHCISQWGHDFRPDYLTIREVVASNPQMRVMAVTATATPSVREDITRQLGLGTAPRARPFVEVMGFSRRNLNLSVMPCSSDDSKLYRVVRLMRMRGAGIVYAATRRHAISVHEKLQAAFGTTNDFQLLLYHGALSDDERTAVQNEFVSAKCPVVVATVAFGMGVDRADIRFVAHWDVPGGVEAYYQEVGRAGRDGNPAWCELLFNYADVRTQEFFVDGANPTGQTAASVLDFLDRHRGTSVEIDQDVLGRRIGVRNGIAIDTTLKVLANLGVLTRCGDERSGRKCRYLVHPDLKRDLVAQTFASRREKERRDRQRLRMMVDYCYSTQCRHKFILNYFGDQSKSPSCGGCDICSRRAVE